MILDNKLQYNSIEDSIEAFKNGNFLIVLDSPSRENEGDLVIAASAMTPEKMAFMIYHTSGLICTPILPSLAIELQLPLMVPETDSEDPNKTAYTDNEINLNQPISPKLMVTADANHTSITTGISAHDRALTCSFLASCTTAIAPESENDKISKASLFRRPGHVFPLLAQVGLTRKRRGHTEAVLEFCRLAKLPMVGVISELVEGGVEVEGKAERKEPGMMRGEACLKFGKKWGLMCCSIEDLVNWIEKNEGDLEKT
ncbi:3,4-dihydroxy-2-butanone 4-phosphate synthase [Erysiphe neolycopersici]|uniref:3,4-dihydroxy-2-butanone 4-phosphate synthase n=1 Tax=Erysiphe neolycopersici TaxID=212602 RepID=A0A420HUL0_9PEZI|nr:3,4-dihydroxy-2-butanone 4-phosphate synthase [Erysiphe neolycopersici]